MAKINQFGGVPGNSAVDTRGCLPFEAMLADAIDGTLSPADKLLFDEHLLTCEGCPAMLADAQEGASLLESLRAETPEPSAALLERIFAQTSVLRAKEEEHLRAERRAASEAASLLGRPVAPVQPSLSTLPPVGGKILPFRQRLQARLHVARVTVLQPRFAMTAAMAFFSIALTLNLTGVRLSGFRTSDLRPANMKRGLYETRARVVRYYANLRVVYELESRVRDLQRASDNEGGATRSAEPDTQSASPADSHSSGAGAGAASPAHPGSPAPSSGDAAPREQKARPRPGSGTSRCTWPTGGIKLVELQPSQLQPSLLQALQQPHPEAHFAALSLWYIATPHRKGAQV